MWWNESVSGACVCQRYRCQDDVRGIRQDTQLRCILYYPQGPRYDAMTRFEQNFFHVYWHLRLRFGSWSGETLQPSTEDLPLSASAPGAFGESPHKAAGYPAWWREQTNGPIGSDSSWDLVFERARVWGYLDCKILQYDLDDLAVEVHLSHSKESKSKQSQNGISYCHIARGTALASRDWTRFVHSILLTFILSSRMVALCAAFRSIFCAGFIFRQMINTFHNLFYNMQSCIITPFLCSESKLSKSCEERNSLLKLAEQLSDLVSPCEMIVQTPVPQSYESSLHNSHKLSHLLQLYDDVLWHVSTCCIWIFRLLEFWA